MGLLLEGGWVAVLGLGQRGVGRLLERLPRDGLRQLQRALLHRSLAKPLARSLAPSLSLSHSVGRVGSGHKSHEGHWHHQRRLQST